MTRIDAEILDGVLVSIHTPIQGVTYHGVRSRPPELVSIHTPIQGVTDLSDTNVEIQKFQSTHPYRV